MMDVVYLMPPRKGNIIVVAFDLGLVYFWVYLVTQLHPKCEGPHTVIFSYCMLSQFLIGLIQVELSTEY